MLPTQSQLLVPTAANQIRHSYYHRGILFKRCGVVSLTTTKLLRISFSCSGSLSSTVERLGRSTLVVLARQLSLFGMMTLAVRLAVLCLVFVIYFSISIVSKVLPDTISGNITSDYEPDSDELSRGVSLKPTASWGAQLRQENSIRVLCIGGSVTAGREGKYWDKQKGAFVNIIGVGFVQFLDAFLKEKVSANSYALNEGRSGRGPEDFYGK